MNTADHSCRQRWRTVVACLLFGVAATFATAWGPVLWAPSDRPIAVDPAFLSWARQSEGDWGEVWFVGRGGFGVDIITAELVRHVGTAPSGRMLTWTDEQSPHGLARFAELVVHYARVRRGLLEPARPDLYDDPLAFAAEASVESLTDAQVLTLSYLDLQRRSAAFDVVDVSAGWPLRSFRGTCAPQSRRRGDSLTPEQLTRTRPVDLPPTGRCIILPMWLQDSLERLKARGTMLTDVSLLTPLPATPVWQGFFANSVLYACCPVLVLWSIRGICTTLRRNRGGCAACGYDVGDLAMCPECGLTNAPPMTLARAEVVNQVPGDVAGKRLA